MTCRNCSNCGCDDAEENLSRNPPSLVTISIKLNGDRITRAVPANRTLVEMLRYDVGLTGTRQGCDKGDCGACTVLVDGEPALSCITLAVQVDGCSVRTVEGLAKSAQLHPVQDAFIKHGAAQCGFCTPGMLMSARALLDRNPGANREEIVAALGGNLCRCTGYQKIIDAVEDAGRTLKASSEGHHG